MAQTAKRQPWIDPRLFNDRSYMDQFKLIEVRPVRMLPGDEGCEALIRGDGQRADFWSVYLCCRDGLAECVADLSTARAADSLAEAIMCQHFIVGHGELKSPITSGDIVETAQCLWEACLDVLAEAETSDESEWRKCLRAAVEGVGYAEVRKWMRDLAEPCHTAWERACALEEYGECFDWEWCPTWLSKLEWTEYSCPTPAREEAPAAQLETSYEVAEDATKALEAIVKAYRNPDMVSGNDDRFFSADNMQREAIAAADRVLARMGIVIK